MSFNLNKSRDVDIVFCIDGTGSMTPCLDNVKRAVRTFQDELIARAADENTAIGQLRIKVIVFRDYKDDGSDAMIESRFFVLPEDIAAYEDCIRSIEATGGGDNPESGLEALYLAMSSDFVTGNSDRQVIVLFTDDDAIELQDPERKVNPIYPRDMKVKDVNDMINMWERIGEYAQDSSTKLRDRLKRLVIYAPNNTKYEELSKMSRTYFIATQMENGMQEFTFEDVMSMIVSSISAQ